MRRLSRSSERQPNLLNYLYIYMHQIIVFVTTHYVWIVFATLYLINLLIGHKSQLDSWVNKHRWIGGFLKGYQRAPSMRPMAIAPRLLTSIEGSLASQIYANCKCP